MYLCWQVNSSLPKMCNKIDQQWLGIYRQAKEQAQTPGQPLHLCSLAWLYNVMFNFTFWHPDTPVTDHQN